MAASMFRLAPLVSSSRHLPRGHNTNNSLTGCNNNIVAFKIFKTSSLLQAVNSQF